MENLLEVDENSLSEKFLIEPPPTSQDFTPAAVKAVPKPGFCLKTKDDQDGKVFINICHAENLPEPKSITDEELVKVLEDEDPSGFRIPMSIGEAHPEKDLKGESCTAYDIIVNPKFYGELENRQLLLGFFLTAVLEGLEQKYEIKLDRNWRMLKNRKFFGSLPEQNIRTKSKPWIMEMDSGSTPERKTDHSRIPEPSYTVIKDPAEGHPDFLVMEVHLPKLASSRGLKLQVTDDWLLLETRAEVYRIDKGLPYDVIPEECGAEFDLKTKILTLTFPVLPKEDAVSAKC